MPTGKNKEMCLGCEDDYYNHHQPKGCWCFDSAEVVKKKKVHIDQVPPWNQEPTEVLSCRHEKRHIFVKPDQTR